MMNARLLDDLRNIIAAASADNADIAALRARLDVIEDTIDMFSFDRYDLDEDLIEALDLAHDLLD